MTEFYRIYTSDDGETHFEDIEPTAVSTSQASVASWDGGKFADWHNEGRRQYVICLAGEVEITVSDGEVRKQHPGTVTLAEDLTGKGHQTRTIGDQPCTWMFVALAD
jgi:quercetin dioxygenase-like cupin family protein